MEEYEPEWWKQVKAMLLSQADEVLKGELEKVTKHKTDMIKELDNGIALLRRIRAEAMKAAKLSDKAMKADYKTATPKQINKMNADLNWQLMTVDKAMTDFARHYAKAEYSTGTEEKTYHPSGFHVYKQ